MPDHDFGGARSDLRERELYGEQQSIVGRIDTAGILGVAVFVPIALRDHVAVSVTLVWSVLVMLTTVGWSDLLPWSRSRTAAIAVWASGAVWALLPWMVFTALDDVLVAWVVVAVCAYGFATDALLLPQTFHLRVYPLMFTYGISYVLALGWHQHWLQIFGLAILSLHLGAGIWGFERIKQRFLSSQAETEAEAFRDSLTGLGSRGAAMREIERRLAADEAVHCIVADIDDFKAINTHLGHHGGDAALVALAGELQTRLKGWFVARLGGDEFIAINHRGLHPSEEGLLTSIDIGVLGSSGSSQIVSLSLGASSTHGDTDADRLLTEASAALSRAKKSGKQRMIVADDDLRDEEHQRQQIATVAHEALVSGEIVAWAQPIYDLRLDRRAGLELLARWRHGRRMVPPDVFVPVIEAQGLGSLLADCMLEYALDTLQRLSLRGDQSSFVSVNLSALSMLEPELPARLTEGLAARNLDPARLIIEMTESQQLPNTAAARLAVDRLRGVGVGIASDDLGAGWSSINQMIETAFTHVKVDRTLINASDRHGGGELMSSIRTLAEGAGQIAIAEGIETPQELQRVIDAGFTLGQGYLMGRPAPIDEVLTLFDEEPIIIDPAENAISP